MNKNKLEKWVTGLKTTIAENKDIKLESHADLVKEMTLYLPELSECHGYTKNLGGWSLSKDGSGVCHFGDDSWADALAMYLEITVNETDYIYQSLSTFQGDKFPYKTLISRWSSVLDKVVEEYNESLKLLDLGNLEQYVLALKTVSEKIKTYQGPMEPSSGVITDDMIGTNGYHSALISIVAKDLPGLQECYDRIQKRGGWEYSEDLEQVRYYSYNHWADALALYLGFPFDEVTYVHTSLRKSLCDWAAKHEEIWDNIHGKDMFSLDKSGAAFGGYGERFPYLIIIDYWAGVFDRLKAELARIETNRLEEKLKEAARTAIRLGERHREKLKTKMQEKARIEALAEKGRLELLDRMQKRLLREEAADKKAIKKLTGIVVFIVIVLLAIYMYTNNYTI